jgi:hypothetical protein
MWLPWRCQCWRLEDPGLPWAFALFEYSRQLGVGCSELGIQLSWVEDLGLCPIFPYYIKFYKILRWWERWEI